MMKELMRFYAEPHPADDMMASGARYLRPESSPPEVRKAGERMCRRRGDEDG